MSEQSKLHRVAVFGTLKVNQSNHLLLDNSEYVGKALVKATMYNYGAFPTITLGGEHDVHCEVYDVDDATLARLDRLEGCPGWYSRDKVGSTIGPVWIYNMDAADTSLLPVIKSGNWTPEESRSNRRYA